MELKENNFYKLLNTETKETSVVYYYHNEDVNSLGFGFNVSDGGAFISKEDISNKTKIILLNIEEVKDKIVITPRDIIAAFSYCILKQSPYTSVTNLVEILEDIRKELINIGYPDENAYFDKYSVHLYLHKSYDDIYKDLEKIRDNVESFKRLNITKFELDKGISDCNDDKRSVKFAVVGRGIINNRDKDFIDLDACIRNVVNKL